MPNLAALQSLLRLQGPSNVGALSNRGLDIATGMDDFGPTEGELESMQQAEGTQSAGTTGYGVTPSRESLREDSMGKIRRMLKLGAVEAQRSLAEKTQPAIIKGQYDVQAAEKTAQAAEARAQANQDAILQRTQLQIDATGGRQDKTIAAQGARQDDAQASRAARLNPQGMSAISRERAGLQSQLKANEPNALSKMILGRTNPIQAKMDALDNAQQWALKIAREQGPGADVTSALAEYGQTASPEEAAAVERFYLMLQGQ